MKAKKHLVFGKAVTYEQVADVLGMNVQSLRTLCKKKTGGNLESYLGGRGIGKEQFSEMLSGTMIATVEDDQEPDLEEHEAESKQDDDTEKVMRALFGNEYENKKQEESTMTEVRNPETEDKEITETEDKEITETDMKDLENSHERIRLEYLNELIGCIDGIPEMIATADNGNDELKEEIQQVGVKLSALLEAFRIDRYSKAIDWRTIAESMKQFPDIWR